MNNIHSSKTVGEEVKLSIARDNWRRWLWLMLCIAVAAIKFWLVIDDPVHPMDPATPHWQAIVTAKEMLSHSIFSAWQGPESVYSAWIAITNLLGFPLRWATEWLYLFSGICLVAALRNTKIPIPFELLLFFLIAYHPYSFDLHQEALQDTLTVPTIFLSISAALTLAYAAKWWTRFVSSVATALALAVLCMVLGSPLLPAAILAVALGGQLLGVFFKNRAVHRSLGVFLPSGLLGGCLIFLGVLILAWPFLVKTPAASFAAPWQQFTRGPGAFPKVAPPPSASAHHPDDFDLLVHNPGGLGNIAQVKVSGWAFGAKNPITRVVLRNGQGKDLASQSEFFHRPDVTAHLGRSGASNAEKNTGFVVTGESIEEMPEDLEIVFIFANGSEFRGKMLRGIYEDQNLVYSLESFGKSSRPKPLQEWIIWATGWLTEASFAVLYYFFMAAALYRLVFFCGTGLLRLAQPLLYFFSLACLLPLGLRFESLEPRPGFVAFAISLLFSGFSLVLLFAILNDLGSAIAKQKIRTFTWIASPEKTFVVLGLGFGCLWALISPPFQAPDEPAHFYRAYQVSEFKFSPERRDNLVGGSLPISLSKAVGRFNHLAFKNESRTGWKQIRAVLKMRLNPQARTFHHFPNTSLYTAIPYLPQALGIALGRIFELGPLYLMYLGRLSNLLVWVLLGFFTLKIVPIAKWLLMAVALMPMALYEASSLAADEFTLGVCLLLIAMILRPTLGAESRLKNADLALLTLLWIALSLSKSVYFLIGGLAIFIPTRSFGSLKRRSIFLTVSVGLNAILIAAFMLKSKTLYVPARNDIFTSVDQQMTYIIQHPLGFLLTLGRTFYHHGLELLEQCIGRMGWLDTVLPFWLWASFALFLLGLAIVDHCREKGLSLSLRGGLFTVGSSTFLLVCTALYLHWDAIGSPLISLQGRYFLPIVPIFLLLFYNRKINIPGHTPLLATFVPSNIFLTLVSTTLVILGRYYS